MNLYKKLIGNSVIFAIGNLGSKLISFILVPLYTYYLTAEEYGVADLVTITSNLLLPIISVNIFESVLRFTLDKKNSKESVFTNSMIISLAGILLPLFFIPMLKFIEIDIKLVIFIYAILITQINRTILSQFTRAIGKVKLFAIDGILMTLFLGFSNIILLIKLGFGIDGYLISIVLANIFSILFLVSTLKVWIYIDFNLVNFNFLNKMLIYSIPMIPNSIMWWLINASNRYFILFFLGASSNGIYAVANKIPSLLSILSSIFNQSWQISAIEEYDNSDKSRFYSNVFNYYSTFLLLGTTIIVAFCKLFMKYLVADEYYIGWKVIPFLLLGVVFSSFSGFLGTTYLAAMETKGVFKTSIYGGITSLISNLIFIPLFGMTGAALSGMFSFLLMFLVRYFDTKKFMEIEINFFILLKSIFFILIQVFILYLEFGTYLEIVLQIVSILVQFLINRVVLIKLINIFRSKRKIR